MTDEPYRWLEAIANRREYIRDQLKSATPVMLFSRPEGVLLFGAGAGQSKVFEIYDRLALAALGHPVDIEKVRQTAIEAAHLEGFSRAPEDVTARRILNFALGPALKTAFEQIFSSPLIVELGFAELAASPERDVLARLSYDGTHRIQHGGLLVAHTRAEDEAAAVQWLEARITAGSSLRDVVRSGVATWRALTAGSPFAPPASASGDELSIQGRTLELGLLERASSRRARYRSLDIATL